MGFEKKQRCYINPGRLTQAAVWRLQYSVEAILSCFSKSNLRSVDIYQNHKKLGNTTRGTGNGQQKNVCVRSREVNIFNYVFHLHGGIVWRVEEFNATTMQRG